MKAKTLMTSALLPRWSDEKSKAYDKCVASKDMKLTTSVLLPR